MEKIDKIIERLFSLIFPSCCTWCQKDWTFLCADCIKSLKKRKNNNFDGACIEKIFAPLTYSKNPLLQKLIHDIKYNAYYSKIDVIIDPMSDIISKNFSDINVILIPIPLHYKRKIWRWFNQSEIIAKKIQNKSLWKVIMKNGLIIRIKNTLSQALLKRGDRINNLKWAFLINRKEKIDEKAIFIIIDDILSSGSTMENCALELRRHYKNKIFWLVIASDRI